MNKSMLGIIDSTMVHAELEELTLHRSAAAIPFGGRYRLIDFVLSNMVNSGIQSVAIFPKLQYRSLMDHLGSGRNWDLNRKRDGLFFFPSPSLNKSVTDPGSLEHFAEHIDFFNRSTQEYVVIANANTVYNMDLVPLLDWHIESGCDITEVRKDGASLEIYLIKKTTLLELLDSREESGYVSMRDAANDLRSQYKLCYYNYDGYAVTIDSIDKYFTVSMNLLRPEIWKQLFLKERPILTKVKDEPPARYSKTATVHNSMVANGGEIEGTVENSIISRGVKIGKGAVIKNCIIMQKSQIGENCVVENLIMDKEVKIEAGVKVSASPEAPEVIRKGTIKGARATT